MSDIIQFIAAHKPPITSGSYEIQVVQSVEGKKDSPDRLTFKEEETFEAQADFHVAGPRFTLDPQLVDSVFPPAGSLGDHENVLPHVAFTRTTLPWERTLPENVSPDIPWLALLVFDHADGITEPAPMTLEEFGYAAKELEPGQNLTDRVRVIQVDATLLAVIAPSVKDLSHLAHVRQRLPPNSDIQCQNRKVLSEAAVILANRLPKAGCSSVAHLVSLEKPIAEADGQLFPKPKKGGKVTLVSLLSWSFACISHEQNFAGTLASLNRPASAPMVDGGSFRLPAGPGRVKIESILAAGAVPLRQYLRNGEKSVSWYRGPFSAGPLRGDVSDPNFSMKVGARHGDEHLIQDERTGLLDVSYSAAWELGRCLTLRNKRISTEIFLWKQRHARHLALAEVEKKLFHLGGPARAAGVMPDLPPVVATWFDDLRLLRHVPVSIFGACQRVATGGVDSLRAH